MTIQSLELSRPATENAEDDAKGRAVVEATLRDIEAHGDAAVCELTNKFDAFDHDGYHLSAANIAKVPNQDMEDIKFAQDQAVNFAKAQRASIAHIEVETLPGVIFVHKNIPVQSVGCYVPGGKFPMVASAHLSVETAKAAERVQVMTDRENWFLEITTCFRALFLGLRTNVADRDNVIGTNHTLPTKNAGCFTGGQSVEYAQAAPYRTITA